MIDPQSVREAMVEALTELDSNITIYETVPNGTPELPCVLVYPPESIEFKHTRGTSRAVFPVLVLVGPQDPVAQLVLEGLMADAGQLSVYAALTADPTLGGEVSHLRVLDLTSGAYSIGLGGDDNAIGAEFRVEIIG